MGVIRFGRTLPLLLVVIGLVKIFQSTGPAPLDAPAPLYPAGTPPSGFAPGEVPPPSYPQSQPEVRPEVKNG
jgi:hypothetical protein